tara:strand:- start:6640 stop:7236 length:597 start_codon:yes stop_codon:yes gene_type:complete
MNIFIVGGAHDLQIVDDMVNTFRKDGEMIKFDKFYCFEPLKCYEDKYVANFENKHNVDIEFINKAIWIENTTLTFYHLGAGYDFGSSLCEFKSKRELFKHEQGERYDVEAVDFDEWLKENVSADDYVHCDLDIECSEYKVLPHIIEKGSIKLIDLLSVEWHGTNKCGDWATEELRKSIKTHVRVLDHTATANGGIVDV